MQGRYPSVSPSPPLLSAHPALQQHYHQRVATAESDTSIRFISEGEDGGSSSVQSRTMICHDGPLGSSRRTYTDDTITAGGGGGAGGGHVIFRQEETPRSTPTFSPAPRGSSRSSLSFRSERSEGLTIKDVYDAGRSGKVAHVGFSYYTAGTGGSNPARSPAGQASPRVVPPAAAGGAAAGHGQGPRRVVSQGGKRHTPSPSPVQLGRSGGPTGGGTGRGGGAAAVHGRHRGRPPLHGGESHKRGSLPNSSAGRSHEELMSASRAGSAPSSMGLLDKLLLLSNIGPSSSRKAPPALPLNSGTRPMSSFSAYTGSAGASATGFAGNPNASGSSTSGGKGRDCASGLAQSVSGAGKPSRLPPRLISEMGTGSTLYTPSGTTVGSSRGAGGHSGGGAAAVAAHSKKDVTQRLRMRYLQTQSALRARATPSSTPGASTTTAKTEPHAAEAGDGTGAAGSGTANEVDEASPMTASTSVIPLPEGSPSQSNSLTAAPASNKAALPSQPPTDASRWPPQDSFDGWASLSSYPGGPSGAGGVGVDDWYSGGVNNALHHHHPPSAANCASSKLPQQQQQQHQQVVPSPSYVASSSSHDVLLGGAGPMVSSSAEWPLLLPPATDHDYSGGRGSPSLPRLSTDMRWASGASFSRWSIGDGGGGRVDVHPSSSSLATTTTTGAAAAGAGRQHSFHPALIPFQTFGAPFSVTVPSQQQQQPSWRSSVSSPQHAAMTSLTPVTRPLELAQSSSSYARLSTGGVSGVDFSSKAAVAAGGAAKAGALPPRPPPSPQQHTLEAVAGMSSVSGPGTPQSAGAAPPLTFAARPGGSVVVPPTHVTGSCEESDGRLAMLNPLHMSWSMERGGQDGAGDGVDGRAGNANRGAEGQGSQVLLGGASSGAGGHDAGSATPLASMLGYPTPVNTDLPPPFASSPPQAPRLSLVSASQTDFVSGFSPFTSVARQRQMTHDVSMTGNNFSSHSASPPSQVGDAQLPAALARLGEPRDSTAAWKNTSIMSLPCALAAAGGGAAGGGATAAHGGGGAAASSSAAATLALAGGGRVAGVPPAALGGGNSSSDAVAAATAAAELAQMESFLDAHWPRLTHNIREGTYVTRGTVAEPALLAGPAPSSQNPPPPPPLPPQLVPCVVREFLITDAMLKAAWACAQNYAQLWSDPDLDDEDERGLEEDDGSGSGPATLHRTHTGSDYQSVLRSGDGEKIRGDETKKTTTTITVSGAGDARSSLKRASSARQTELPEVQDTPPRKTARNDGSAPLSLDATPDTLHGMEPESYPPTPFHHSASSPRSRPAHGVADAARPWSNMNTAVKEEEREVTGPQSEGSHSHRRRLQLELYEDCAAMEAPLPGGGTLPPRPLRSPPQDSHGTTATTMTTATTTATPDPMLNESHNGTGSPSTSYTATPSPTTRCHGAEVPEVATTARGVHPFPLFHSADDMEHIKGEEELEEEEEGSTHANEAAPLTKAAAVSAKGPKRRTRRRRKTAAPATDGGHGHGGGAGHRVDGGNSPNSSTLPATRSRKAKLNGGGGGGAAKLNAHRPHQNSGLPSAVSAAPHTAMVSPSSKSPDSVPPATSEWPSPPEREYREEEEGGRRDEQSSSPPTPPRLPGSFASTPPPSVAAAAAAVAAAAATNASVSGGGDEVSASVALSLDSQLVSSPTPVKPPLMTFERQTSQRGMDACGSVQGGVNVGMALFPESPSFTSGDLRRSSGLTPYQHPSSQLQPGGCMRYLETSVTTELENSTTIPPAPAQTTSPCRERLRPGAAPPLLSSQLTAVAAGSSAPPKALSPTPPPPPTQQQQQHPSNLKDSLPTPSPHQLSAVPSLEVCGTQIPTPLATPMDGASQSRLNRDTHRSRHGPRTPWTPGDLERPPLPPLPTRVDEDVEEDGEVETGRIPFARTHTAKAVGDPPPPPSPENGGVSAQPDQLRQSAPITSPIFLPGSSRSSSAYADGAKRPWQPTLRLAQDPNFLQQLVTSLRCLLLPTASHPHDGGGDAVASLLKKAASSTPLWDRGEEAAKEGNNGAEAAQLPTVLPYQAKPPTSVLPSSPLRMPSDSRRPTVTPSRLAEKMRGNGGADTELEVNLRGSSTPGTATPEVAAPPKSVTTTTETQRTLPHSSRGGGGAGSSSSTNADSPLFEVANGRTDPATTSSADESMREEKKAQVDPPPRDDGDGASGKNPARDGKAGEAPLHHGDKLHREGGGCGGGYVCLPVLGMQLGPIVQDTASIVQPPPPPLPPPPPSKTSSLSRRRGSSAAATSVGVASRSATTGRQVMRRSSTAGPGRRRRSSVPYVMSPNPQPWQRSTKPVSNSPQRESQLLPVPSTSPVRRARTPGGGGGGIPARRKSFSLSVSRRHRRSAQEEEEEPTVAAATATATATLSREAASPSPSRHARVEVGDGAPCSAQASPPTLSMRSSMQDGVSLPRGPDSLPPITEAITAASSSPSFPHSAPPKTAATPEPSLLRLALAEPLVQQGNVRNQLLDWITRSPPSPVHREHIIRNVVKSILYSLRPLHAVGRGHGSVKSTNVFAAAHARDAVAPLSRLLHQQLLQSAESGSRAAGKSTSPTGPSSLAHTTAHVDLTPFLQANSPPVDSKAGEEGKAGGRPRRESGSPLASPHSPGFDREDSLLSPPRTDGLREVWMAYPFVRPTHDDSGHREDGMASGGELSADGGRGPKTSNSSVDVTGSDNRSTGKDEKKPVTAAELKDPLEWSKEVVLTGGMYDRIEVALMHALLEYRRERRKAAAARARVKAAAKSAAAAVADSAAAINGGNVLPHRYDVNSKDLSHVRSFDLTVDSTCASLLNTASGSELGVASPVGSAMTAPGSTLHPAYDGKHETTQFTDATAEEVVKQKQKRKKSAAFLQDATSAPASTHHNADTTAVDSAPSASVESLHRLGMLLNAHRLLRLFTLHEAEQVPPPECITAEAMPEMDVLVDSTASAFGLAHDEDRARGKGASSDTSSLSQSRRPFRRTVNTAMPLADLTPQADVWMVGILAVELADGEFPPWVGRLDKPFVTLRRRPWSDKFALFVQRCLQPDPTKRATVDELLEDPWFTATLVPGVEEKECRVLALDGSIAGGGLLPPGGMLSDLSVLGAAAAGGDGARGLHGAAATAAGPHRDPTTGVSAASTPSSSVPLGWNVGNRMGRSPHHRGLSPATSSLNTAAAVAAGGVGKSSVTAAAGAAGAGGSRTAFKPNLDLLCEFSLRARNWRDRCSMSPTPDTLHTGGGGGGAALYPSQSTSTFLSAGRGLRESSVSFPQHAQLQPQPQQQQQQPSFYAANRFGDSASGALSPAMGTIPMPLCSRTSYMSATGGQHGASGGAYRNVPPSPPWQSLQQSVTLQSLAESYREDGFRPLLGAMRTDWAEGGSPSHTTDDSVEQGEDDTDSDVSSDTRSTTSASTVSSASSASSATNLSSVVSAQASLEASAGSTAAGGQKGRPPLAPLSATAHAVRITGDETPATLKATWGQPPLRLTPFAITASVAGRKEESESTTEAESLHNTEPSPSPRHHRSHSHHRKHRDHRSGSHASQLHQTALTTTTMSASAAGSRSSSSKRRHRRASVQSSKHSRRHQHSRKAKRTATVFLGAFAAAIDRCGEDAQMEEKYLLSVAAEGAGWPSSTRHWRRNAAAAAAAAAAAVPTTTNNNVSSDGIANASLSVTSPIATGGKESTPSSAIRPTDSATREDVTGGPGGSFFSTSTVAGLVLPELRISFADEDEAGAAAEDTETQKQLSNLLQAFWSLGRECPLAADVWCLTVLRHLALDARTADLVEPLRDVLPLPKRPGRGSVEPEGAGPPLSSTVVGGTGSPPAAGAGSSSPPPSTAAPAAVVVADVSPSAFQRYELGKWMMATSAALAREEAEERW